MQNVVDVGRREKGLGYFPLFFLCFLVFLLTRTGHTKRSITTIFVAQNACCRVRKCFLGFSIIKTIMFGGQNSQKIGILGA